MSRKIILDTDPGIDDAVAMAIALATEELDVQLITTVAGNVGLHHTTQNALNLLKFYGYDVPVARGADGPLLRKSKDASNVHGDNGMVAYELPIADNSNLLDIHAVEAIRDVIEKLDENEKITIVPVGPLTNMALFIKQYPSLLAKVDEIVLMGGAFGRGNSGVYAEFNIHYDPEAAKIVFESGLPITVAPLEVGNNALLTMDEAREIRDMHEIGEMFYTLFTAYRSGSGLDGISMYDSTAIAILLSPEIYEFKDVYVGIETDGKLTSGATVMDFNGYLDMKPNAKVAVEIDQARFKEWFMEALRNCGK